MEFLNCKLDLESIKRSIELDDILYMSQSKNFEIDFEEVTDTFTSGLIIIFNIIARRLPEYSVYLCDVEFDTGKFNLCVNRLDEGKMDYGDANTIQNELYYVIIPELIKFNDKEYSGFTYMHTATGGFEYEIVEWPRSQELIDNGETIILINDEFSNKILCTPAYFVMK